MCLEILKEFFTEKKDDAEKKEETVVKFVSEPDNNQVLEKIPTEPVITHKPKCCGCIIL